MHGWLSSTSACSPDASTWGFRPSSMWPSTEAVLWSAAVRHTDWFLKLGSRRRILKDGAKTICKGVQERKQVPLYLMSLDQPAKRTGGGWMERLPEIKCRGLNSSVLVNILLKWKSAGYHPSEMMLDLFGSNKVVNQWVRVLTENWSEKSGTIPDLQQGPLSLLRISSIRALFCAFKPKLQLPVSLIPKQTYPQNSGPQ